MTSRKNVRVVGLDLSITSTGVSDGYTHSAYRTTPQQPMEQRLNDQVIRVRSFIGNPVSFQFDGSHVADLVLIEGPSFRSQGPGHDELSGLRWMVRTWLWRRGIPFAIVPPATLKLYTAGNGRADKLGMVVALDARHGTEFASVKLSAGRVDQADAFALAAMGYDYLGWPLESDLATAFHPPVREAFGGVRWPDVPARS